MRVLLGIISRMVGYEGGGHDVEARFQRRQCLDAFNRSGGVERQRANE